VCFSFRCSDGSFYLNLSLVPATSTCLALSSPKARPSASKALKFIADPSDDQGLLPEGNDSGDVFMGMASSGSPSLHAIQEESPSEDDLASSDGESFGFPVP
jgi:hypothetical protein